MIIPLLQQAIVKNASKKYIYISQYIKAEKQSIQNSLLLMKGTSGDAGSSEENIELLEKKLEEITKELENYIRLIYS